METEERPLKIGKKAKRQGDTREELVNHITEYWEGKQSLDLRTRISLKTLTGRFLGMVRAETVWAEV
jgi:hypothetical protein